MRHRQTPWTRHSIPHCAKNLRGRLVHPRFTPARFEPSPPQINQFVSSVNGLRHFRGTLPNSFALASWNHKPPTTTGSSEQTQTRDEQPILPLFVLTLCCWLTAAVPDP